MTEVTTDGAEFQIQLFYIQELESSLSFLLATSHSKAGTLGSATAQDIE